MAHHTHFSCARPIKHKRGIPFFMEFHFPLYALMHNTVLFQRIFLPHFFQIDDIYIFTDLLYHQLILFVILS